VLTSKAFCTEIYIRDFKKLHMVVALSRSEDITVISMNHFFRFLGTTINSISLRNGHSSFAYAASGESGCISGISPQITSKSARFLDSVNVDMLKVDKSVSSSIS